MIPEWTKDQEADYMKQSADYQARMSALSRAELLKLCRAGGLTAHESSTAELPLVIWLNFGFPKWKRDNGLA
jgi:UDP-N-acetylglucosamine:LPS N-acetylglucosamine transferase